MATLICPSARVSARPTDSAAGIRLLILLLYPLHRIRKLELLYVAQSGKLTYTAIRDLTRFLGFLSVKDLR